MGFNPVLISRIKLDSEKIWSVLSFALSLLIFSSVAKAGEIYPGLEKWFQVREIIYSNRPWSERKGPFSEEWELRKSAAKEVFQGFLRQEFDSHALENSLSPLPDGENFRKTLHDTFLNSSLAKLGEGRSASFEVLNARIRKEYERGAPLFSLKGFFNEQSPAPFAAGFHPGSRSIYMDIGRITPDLWWVKFAHEVMHYLDDTLEQARSSSPSAGVKKQIAEVSLRTSDPKQIPEDLRPVFETWIKTRLDLSLWAEFRAWAATYRIYDDGIRERLWGPVGFMEEVRGLKPASEDFHHFLYRFIDDKTTVVHEGLFEHKLVQNVIAQIRGLYRKNRILPPLGNLGEIVNAKR